MSSIAVTTAVWIGGDDVVARFGLTLTKLATASCWRKCSS